MDMLMVDSVEAASWQIDTVAAIVSRATDMLDMGMLDMVACSVMAMDTAVASPIDTNTWTRSLTYRATNVMVVTRWVRKAHRKHRSVIPTTRFVVPATSCWITRPQSVRKTQTDRSNNEKRRPLVVVFCCVTLVARCVSEGTTLVCTKTKEVNH